MGKEYIWGADVDHDRTTFRVVVEDGICMTYEGDTLTNRLSYAVPEDEEQMWIDEVIEVWGKRCRFQLDKGVPYLQMDGKWTASDTTMEARMERIAKNQKLSGIVQAVMGAVLCLVCLVAYLVGGDLDNWWFTAVIGSVMIVTGILQYRNVKKEFNV